MEGGMHNYSFAISVLQQCADSSSVSSPVCLSFSYENSIDRVNLLYMHGTAWYC